MPESQAPVKVLFAKAGWKPSAGFTGPAIVVSATRDNFNDFGYRFRTLAHVFSDEGVVRSMQHRLMFDQHDVTRTVLDTFAADSPMPMDRAPAPFCSVFGLADHYDTLVDVFGVERAISALQALNDANVMTDDERDRAAMALTSTEAFALGMIRDAETYDAFRRGRRRLMSTQPADIQDAAASFAGQFRVGRSWRTISVDFDFEPDDFLRDRIAVLVGPNGMGKSTILGGILGAIRSGRTAEAGDDDWHDFLSPPPRFRKVVVVDSSDAARYPRQLESDEGHDYLYLTQTGAGETAAMISIALIDVLRDFQPLFVGAADATQATRKSLLREVLSRLGLWEGLHIALIEGGPRVPGAFRAANGGGSVYCVAVRSLTSEKQALLAYQNADHRRGPVHVRQNQVVQLSSGQLMFFRFAVLLVSAIETASLFLIDEPENHLHPHYVAELMALLDRVLKPTRSCAVIATHSPFIVREVPRRRVRVLHRQDGETLADPPRLQTFGASIEAISQAVFSDGEDARLHEEILNAWIEERGFGPEDMPALVQAYGDELNPETLSYIALRLRNRK